jgi:energy-coupling factor transport system substrate-specific component
MKNALPVGIVSLAGIVLFAWPFAGSGLPANTPAWTLTLAAVAALLLIEAGTRQLDSRAIALLAAIAGGGVGPWVPYQVFGAGWIGVVAGLAGQWRSATPNLKDVITLAAIGALMGYVFGALLDVTVWVPAYRGNPILGWNPGIPTQTALVNFGRFYLLTSFAYDTFRAVGNAVMVLALGAPVMAALARLRARLTFEVVTA